MPRRIASESRPKQKTGRRKLIEFDEGPGWRSTCWRGTGSQASSSLRTRTIGRLGCALPFERVRKPNLAGSSEGASALHLGPPSSNTRTHAFRALVMEEYKPK